MKKLSIILLVILLLSLAGCGKPAVTPETVSPSGTDYFYYGKLDTSVTFEECLAILTEKGYVISVTDNQYYITIDGMADPQYHTKHYAYITVYDDEETASHKLKDLYLCGYAAGWESMVQLGNVTVNGKGGIFRSILGFYGIEALTEQSPVSGKVLLSGKTALASDYKAKLEAAGFDLYSAVTSAHKTNAETLFAIADDNSYGFNLYRLKDSASVDDFFSSTLYSITSASYVYSVCTLNNETYILYAPLDTVTALITLLQA